jgi:hypothetical protein
MLLKYCRMHPADVYKDKLVHGALLVMCHMAVTPVGRSAIAAAGCLPRWLPSIRKLPPKLQQLVLLLPLTCLRDFTKEEYYLPLYRGGQWVADGLDVGACSSLEFQASCSPLLKQQVRIALRTSFMGKCAHPNVLSLSTASALERQDMQPKKNIAWGSVFGGTLLQVGCTRT